jgi:arylsulfatase A-like enzyme/thioredoxin-like negative regulator of GroEL
MWQVRQPGRSRPAVARTPDQNVLLITVDTLRADALGCYGGPAATPNLDRLAASGVRYDFAHAHAVMTLPSHASILTGLYPFQHGIRDNSGYRLTPGTPTLASRLAAQGYDTGAFIGGFPLDSRFGLDAGFGVYDDQMNETRQSSEFTLAERPADAVVRRALDWLAGRQRRWFAWVHVFDPHAPYSPPGEFGARYASAPYAGEVAFVDASLGALLDRVRTSSDRPTLVLVTGDHGEGLGDHGEATHGVFAYEATLRIPLVVAQVGGGRPEAGGHGAVSAEPVQHVDVLPTVLAALAAGAVPDGPGRALIDPVADADARAAYFEALSPSLNRGWAPLRGVVVGREKFIDLPLWETYDLARDPEERANLADTDPTRRQVLQARLREFGSTDPAARQAEDPETAARLRSLGYTSGSPSTARKAYTEDDDPKRLVDLDQAMHRGLVLFQEGRVREAISVYRDIVSRRPDMAVASLHLAFLLGETGDAGGAVATLAAAREKAPADPEIEWRLGMYLSETGRIEEALSLLEPAGRRPDAGVDALNALGICYARAGRPADALSTFERILTIDARDAMAWQNIGSLHLQAGRRDAARDAFARSIAISPGWAASYTGLGVVELQSGSRRAAIAAWTNAVELNPSDFDALFNLATELINDGQAAAARPHVERFVATAPPTFYAKDIARLRAWLARLPG